MKHLHACHRRILSALFLGTTLFSFLPRALDAGTSSPEATIREFYQWYVSAVLANKEPLEKDSAALQRYVSDRLLREVETKRNSPDGLEADPFLDAQDFDKDWAKNITVSKQENEGGRVRAVVELKGEEMGTHKLHVHLVQERGGWKLDKVEGR